MTLYLPPFTSFVKALGEALRCFNNWVFIVFVVKFDGTIQSRGVWNPERECLAEVKARI